MSNNLRGMVPKPNHERFDMSMAENVAFWLIIIPEYEHRYVRSNSILLYNNTKPAILNEGE